MIVSKKNILLLITIIAILPSEGFAGLFGPENYDECMLEKMKGQDIRMYDRAKNACEKLFPPEVMIDVGYRKDEMKFEIKKEASKIYLFFKKKDEQHEITKVTLRFFPNKYDPLLLNNKSFYFVKGRKKSEPIYFDIVEIDLKDWDIVEVWGRKRK